MKEKDIDEIRKKFFSDLEPDEEKDQENLTFEDLFKSGEEPEPSAPKEAPPLLVKEEEEPEKELTPKEKEALTLKQIRRLVSGYRWLLAETQRRVDELRYKLAGLETEYRVLVGEPPPPLPEPEKAAPTPMPEPAEPAPVIKARAPRRSNAPWSDARKISLEEAAWRVLTEQGKSMPLWRIASAIRRKGFPGAFTESALGGEVSKSGRLSFTGEGHIYIK